MLDELEMLRHENRAYLQALERIAQLLGLDTTREPEEGVLDVIEAVERLVHNAQ